MSALGWLREAGDGDWRIERIDPCEAGTCAHDHGAPRLFDASPADVLANHPGPVGRNNPVTARDAALKNAPRSGTQRAACLHALAAAGERGLTGYECWERTPTKWPHVATTRLEELTALGLAEQTAEERDGFLVWRITDVGRWVSDELRRAEQS